MLLRKEEEKYSSATVFLFKTKHQLGLVVHRRILKTASILDKGNSW